MKKGLALLLSVAMVASSLPMTAFASTDNNVSKIPTVETDDLFTTSIIMDEFNGLVAGQEKQTIKLTLTNAEFQDSQFPGGSAAALADLNNHITTFGSDATVAANLATATTNKAATDTAYTAADTAHTTALNTLTNLNAAIASLNAIPGGGDATTAISQANAGGVTITFANPGAATSAEVSTALAALSGPQTSAVTAESTTNTTLIAATANKTTNDTAFNTAQTISNDRAIKRAAAASNVVYTKLSDTMAMAEFYVYNQSDTITLALQCKATDDGDANVTIEDVDSIVSSQTLKIANVASGSTTTTISDTVAIKDSATPIKNVVVTETTAGTLEAGELKLRLTNGFHFTGTTPSVVVFPTNGGSGGTLAVTFLRLDNDTQDAIFSVSGSSTTAATLSFQNIEVYYDDDDADIGDECSITVSGAGMTKQSIVVGTATDYGVAFEIYKDTDMPTFYSGTYDDETDTLTVRIKENISSSWLDRKTKIVFPEGVEIVDFTHEGEKNFSGTPTFSIDENELTISNILPQSSGSSKKEIRLKFQLSVAPDFIGDITATLTGSAIGDDQELVVGEAKFPVSVSAGVNELMIDYRNTPASDITITEADAGVLKKDTTFALKIDNISFDGDPEVEVTDGDLKIETVKVKDDMLTFKIKTESQKTAGVIKISGINLYMERSLPAGEYDLQITSDDKEATLNNSGGDHKNKYLNKLSNNAIVRNFNDDDSSDGVFDISDVTVLKGYVTIVTAGREQDDSTFTTRVVVTIGANTLTAGTNVVSLDVPAYISNGYTMLPIRAVTEALSGSAIVRWDDPTKTVTITFGQRVVNMTVGSRIMVINGVNVAMSAKCEITNSRSFIPLRDLGYALGLNDSKIGWDDSTKTATLN